MRILLRRCTTQFLGLDVGLEEDDPGPDEEEVDDLEGNRERERKKRWKQGVRIE